MAVQIPGPEQIARVSAHSGRIAPNAPNGAVIGQALANVGKSITQAAYDLNDLRTTEALDEQRKRGNDVSTALTRFLADEEQRFLTAQEEAGESGIGFTRSFMEEHQKRANEFGKTYEAGLSDADMAQYTNTILSRGNSLYQKAFSFEGKAKGAYYDRVTNQGLDTYRKQIRYNAAPFDEVKAQGLRQIDTTDMPEWWKAERRAAWDKDAAESKWKWEFEQDPEAAVRALRPSHGAAASADDAAADEYASIDYDRREQLADWGIAEIKRQDTQRSAEMRAAIDIAVANAPSAIMNTGSYTGTMPTSDMFVAAYGEDGGQRYNQFVQSVETSKAAHQMQAMPTAEVLGMVASAEPRSSGDNAALETARYETLSRAAEATIKAREADPSSYVRRLYPHVEQAWQDASMENGFQQAFAVTAAAQQQLGIRNMQLLPKNVADGAVEQFKDVNKPEAERMASVAGLIMATSDPEQQRALFEQLVEAGLPDMTEGAFAALSRGDEGAARRLFQAATIDPTKLPGIMSSDDTSLEMSDIDEAVQKQFMADGRVGDVYYGLADGTTENYTRAERDARLLRNAILLRMKAGEVLETAVSGAARDIVGDVKVINRSGYVGAKILVPMDADEGEILDGLSGMLPRVRAAMEDRMSIPQEAPAADGTRAILEATTSNFVNNVMSEGFFRNSGDDSFMFFNPYTGTPVLGPDDKPLVFTMDEIKTAAPGASRTSEMERQERRMWEERAKTFGTMGGVN